MKKVVYIRPLIVEDALITYQWRNNPSIWPYSGLRPDNFTTPEIEQEWLATVLMRDDEKRFAICLESSNQVVGCIYLTSIKDNHALMHIYFGELQYWRGKKAYKACCLLFDYAFKTLNLDYIFIEINSRNRAATLLARQMGYEKVEIVYDSIKGALLDKMVFKKEMYLLKFSN